MFECFMGRPVRLSNGDSKVPVNAYALIQLLLACSVLSLICGVTNTVNDRDRDCPSATRSQALGSLVVLAM